VSELCYRVCWVWPFDVGAVSCIDTIGLAVEDSVVHEPRGKLEQARTIEGKAQSGSSWLETSGLKILVLKTCLICVGRTAQVIFAL
jgi:hypothetical protein